MNGSWCLTVSIVLITQLVLQSSRGYNPFCEYVQLNRVEASWHNCFVGHVTRFVNGHLSIFLIILAAHVT
jgi:hypothetical protein